MAEKIAYYAASFASYLLERAGLRVTDLEPIQEMLAARDLVTDRTLPPWAWRAPPVLSGGA